MKKVKKAKKKVTATKKKKSTKAKPLTKAALKKLKGGAVIPTKCASSMPRNYFYSPAFTTYRSFTPSFSSFSGGGFSSGGNRARGGSGKSI